jgi:hypothetical protein
MSQSSARVLIGTMAALVLGLLIASAKSSYDTKSTQIKQITANIIQLDLDLERYGAERWLARRMRRGDTYGKQQSHRANRCGMTRHISFPGYY